MKEKQYYIYVVTNFTNNVLYVGVTNNIITRVYEHKKGLIEGFTKKYNLKKLLYFEEYNSSIEAISREKQLKAWKRDWKINLIKTKNPDLIDLYKQLVK